MSETSMPDQTPPAPAPVRDNVDAERYEIVVDGEVAFLEYRRRKNVMALIHTEVPDALRGRGLAPVLAKWALDAARNEGRHVLVICPFIRTYLKRHPEYDALVTTEA
jgi:hypothetical protein